MEEIHNWRAMRFVIYALLLAIVAKADIGTVPLDPLVTPTHMDYYCMKTEADSSKECKWLRWQRNRLSLLAHKADAFWKTNHNILMDTSFKNFTSVYVGEMKIDRLNFVLRDEGFRGPSGRVVIKRRMRIEESGNYEKDLIIASTRLNVPKVLPPMLDTMALSVDHTFVEPFYLRVMLASAMAVGSLKMDPKHVSEVLQIGLGAGLMNNFFHNRFPNMKITIIDYDPLFALLAQKYFHLKLDAKQEVIHSEAVDYFKQAVKKGLQYDVMFFDACDNSYREDDGVCCPVRSLLEPQNVKLFRQALKPTGMLAMSLMYDARKIKVTREELIKETVKKMQSSFEQCYGLKYDVVLIDVIILCGPLGEVETLKSRVTSYAEKLGIGLVEDWTQY